MKYFFYSAMFVIFASNLQENLAVSSDNLLSQSDTWSLQAILTRSIPGSAEGSSVSLSGDGNIIAIGAPSDFGSSIGGTQIYVRSGATWKYQTTLSQRIPNSDEGYSVSLSADGNTLAVGAPNFDNNGLGVTQIYIRSGNVWKYQTTLSQGISNSDEGTSVSLSADGNTLAVGAPNAGTGFSGETEVYIRTGNNWSHQVSLSQENVGSLEGSSVSLSATDANTLAVGCPAFSPNSKSAAGGVQVYIKSNNLWEPQAILLSQQVAGSCEGKSVSLSANGNILASGAPLLNNTVGATYIYSRSGNIWKLQTTLNARPQENSNDGTSVSLSANGNMLISTQYPDSIQIYAQSGTTWNYQTSFNVTGSDNNYFVSLSPDGNTFAIGAPTFNSSTGETFVYIN
jgi:hypothetical protein